MKPSVPAAQPDPPHVAAIEDQGEATAAAFHQFVTKPECLLRYPGE